MGRDQWYKKQLRIVQTVLREPDIVDYDAEAVVAYLKEIKANCIIAHGGGDTDFFRSDLELSNPTPFMGDEDILSQLIDQAHRAGIKVMARVDFRGVQKERYERYPHWFSLDENDQPVSSTEHGLYAPCYSGIYANDYAARFIRDLMDRYDLDGIWENAIGFGLGACYCKVCRDKYREDTGREIPRGKDYYSDDFEEYRNWKAIYADRHIKLMKDTLKEYGEGKAYCAEIFGIHHAFRAKATGIDLYNAKEHFDFLACPTFLSTRSPKKGHYYSLWTPASSVRFMKSVNKDKQSIMLYGNNGGKWRYIKDPSLETRLWLWETVSVGGGIWNCLFNGQHPGAAIDRRNSYLEMDAYHYLAENEELLKNQVPKEDVGIFFSKASRDSFAADDEDRDGYGVFIKGVENVLMDRHIQYGFCPDINFSLEEAKKYKALMIPNGACLSDEHIKIIKEYVKSGGGLIASYETSLYDERGKKREDFGLGDLFGCSYTGIKKDTSLDSYQRIKENHDIVSTMGDTPLLMNDGETLLCTPLKKEGYREVCTYVPKIPNQPPPKAWIKNMETPYPTLMAGQYGKGRVVYFANQVDKLCFTNGHEDFTDLLYNSIMWIKNGDFILKTNAPDSVHIAITEDRYNENKQVLSLINLTSGPSRPIKNLVPVYNFYIECNLSGDGLKDHKVLRKDGNIRVRLISRKKGSSRVRIEVDRLDEFSAISFETR